MVVTGVEGYSVTDTDEIGHTVVVIGIVFVMTVYPVLLDTVYSEVV